MFILLYSYYLKSVLFFPNEFAEMKNIDCLN